MFPQEQIEINSNYRKNQTNYVSSTVRTIFPEYINYQELQLSNSNYDGGEQTFNPFQNERGLFNEVKSNIHSLNGTCGSVSCNTYYDSNNLNDENINNNNIFDFNYKDYRDENLGGNKPCLELNKNAQDISYLLTPLYPIQPFSSPLNFNTNAFISNTLSSQPSQPSKEEDKSSNSNVTSNNHSPLILDPNNPNTPSQESDFTQNIDSKVVITLNLSILWSYFVIDDEISSVLFIIPKDDSKEAWKDLETRRKIYETKTSRKSVALFKEESIFTPEGDKKKHEAYTFVRVSKKQSVKEVRDILDKMMKPPENTTVNCTLFYNRDNTAILDEKLTIGQVHLNSYWCKRRRQRNQTDQTRPQHWVHQRLRAPDGTFCLSSNRKKLKTK